MTLSYSGGFRRLLLYWRGSLWQSTIIYLSLFYGILALYKFAMPPNIQHWFRVLAIYIDTKSTSSIPIFFLLGQYVVTVVRRWWQQFENIGWPDNFMFLVSAHIRGRSEEMRALRRVIARYTVLTAVLAWRNLSSRVLKRFPTTDHIVRTSLMTTEEAQLYAQMPSKYGRWYLPIQWIQSLIIEQRDHGALDTSAVNALLKELYYYKDKHKHLFVRDWVTIPLVYTQVVTVATYGYFFLCLIGRQHMMIDSDWGDHVERNFNSTKFGKPPVAPIYFPILTMLEFIFYMGWLKVAEHLMYPFGEQDDDFELNYILDRHLHVAYHIADLLHEMKPENIVDPYEGNEPQLRHTRASRAIHEIRPASKHITLPFVEMELLGDSDDEDNKSRKVV